MARAAKVAPENVDILTLYARTIRTAAGNQPTAASAQIMQRILTLDPDNVEALFFTGLAANGAGDKRRSLTTLGEGEVRPAGKLAATSGCSTADG